MVKISLKVLALGSISLVPLAISQYAKADKSFTDQDHSHVITIPFKKQAMSFVAEKLDEGLKVAARGLAPSIKKLAGDLIYADPDRIDAEGRPIYFKNARTLRNILKKVGVEADSLFPGASFVFNKVENRIAAEMLKNLESGLQTALYTATLKGLQKVVGAEEARVTSLLNNYAPSKITANEDELQPSVTEEFGELLVEDETTVANVIKAQLKVNLHDWILKESTKLVQSGSKQILVYAEEKAVDSATQGVMYGVYGLSTLIGGYVAPSFATGAIISSKAVSFVDQGIRDAVHSLIRYVTGSQDKLASAITQANSEAEYMTPALVDAALEALNLTSLKPTESEREMIVGKVDSVVHNSSSSLSQDWNMGTNDDAEVVEITRTPGYFQGMKKNFLSRLSHVGGAVKGAVTNVGNRVAKAPGLFSSAWSKFTAVAKDFTVALHPQFGEEE